MLTGVVHPGTNTHLSTLLLTVILSHYLFLPPLLLLVFLNSLTVELFWHPPLVTQLLPKRIKLYFFFCCSNSDAQHNWEHLWVFFCNAAWCFADHHRTWPLVRMPIVVSFIPACLFFSFVQFDLFMFLLFLQFSHAGCTLVHLPGFAFLVAFCLYSSRVSCQKFSFKLTKH